MVRNLVCLAALVLVVCGTVALFSWVEDHTSLRGYLAFAAVWMAAWQLIAWLIERGDRRARPDCWR